MAANEFADAGGFVWVDQPGFEWEGRLPADFVRLTAPCFTPQLGGHEFKNMAARHEFNKDRGGCYRFGNLSTRLGFNGGLDEFGFTLSTTVRFGFKSQPEQHGFSNLTNSLGFNRTDVSHYRFLEMSNRHGFEGWTTQYGFIQAPTVGGEI